MTHLTPHLTLKDVQQCKDTLKALYLDYVNNFLSVERLAEYYNLDYYHAIELMEVGRILFKDEQRENKSK